MLFAAEEVEPLLRRLDPQSRAAVLAALFALVVLGLALVLFISLGGRYVRRLSRRVPPVRPPIQSDWDRKLPADKPPENE